MIESNKKDTYIATKENDASNVKCVRFSKTGENWVEFGLPLFTTSEANGGVKKSYKRNGKTCYKSEHWSEKHRRHRLQKGSIALILRPIHHHLRMPCRITLTRYAPRKLDQFDNLPMSLKYILDAICEIITNDYTPGRADSHEGLEVIFKQVICSEYGVSARIENI